MTNLGKLAYFLGMENIRTSKGLILYQTKYATEIPKKFNMLDCNSSITPSDANIRNEVKEDDESIDPTMFRRLVGSLRYLCQSRLDISYSVGTVSRFMSNPLKTHFLATKKILRYINGTLQYGIIFPETQESEQLIMIGYSDADWCGDKIDRRSSTGFVFMLQGAPISWSSKKQSIAALLSCEAEYLAGSYAACQANWLQNVLEQLVIKLEKSIKLLIDNKSAINLANNPISHGKRKHIETRFHYLRDQVNKCKIKVEYCPTLNQVADIFTKPVKRVQFLKLRRELSVVCFDSLN